MHLYQVHTWHQTVRGAADTLKHRAAIQSDLDRVEEWTSWNLMTPKKCPALGKKANPGHHFFPSLEKRLRGDLIALYRGGGEVEVEMLIYSP